MHPNPTFRCKSAAQNLAFARARGFGLLTLGGRECPLASHIPFVVNDAGTAFAAHLVRSNPIRRALAGGGDDGMPALMVVSGPDGYVSPDWYGLEDQVPTWNYVTVHLFGRASLRPEDELRAHLAALSEWFEARLAPEAVWRVDKLQAATCARLARMIRPIEFTIERVEGTWKLGQNKAEGARRAAALEVSTSPLGMETATLSALMREPSG